MHDGGAGEGTGADGCDAVTRFVERSLAPIAPRNLRSALGNSSVSPVPQMMYALD